MSDIKISNTESLEHDSTQIEGVLEMSYQFNPTYKQFGGDGQPIERELVDFDVTGDAAFSNLASYNQALGGAESNLAVTTRKKGGGTRVLTFKNVVFETSRNTVPNLQAQGGGSFRCSFRSKRGPSDVIETFVTDADGA